MLRYSAPPGYRRREPVRRPNLDAFTDGIDCILEEDRSAPRKQRHTGKRISTLIESGWAPIPFVFTHCPSRRMNPFDSKLLSMLSGDVGAGDRDRTDDIQLGKQMLIIGIIP